MIIKGARIRISGKAAGETVAHLVNGDANEIVRIVQGTVADVYDMVSDARRHNRLFGFRHFIISPEVATSTSLMMGLLSDLGTEFSFDPKAAFVVEHQKPRAGQTTSVGHLHAVVPEIDVATGRVLSSSHSYLRHERVAREAEYKLAHPFVHGAHHAAVVAALKRMGRFEVADALTQAFPSENQVSRPHSAYSDTVHATASQAGLDLPAARLAVSNAWQSTNTRLAFEQAIGDCGLTVRLGERASTWIVEGPEGVFVGSLARLTRSRKADVISRMEKLDVESSTPVFAASDNRGGNVPDGPRDLESSSPDSPSCATSGGHGNGDWDDGTASLSPRSVGRRPSAEQGFDGSGDRAARHSCRGEVAEGNSSLKLPAIPAVLMGLAKPDFGDRLIDLQAASNIGARNAFERAVADLTKIQEQAERAQWMADRPIIPSAAVLSAEETAKQARRTAARATKEAEAAASARIDHRAGQPRGFHWLLGLVTGTIARHAAKQRKLEEASTAAKAKAEAAKSTQDEKEHHAKLTAESHAKWEKDDRQHWRVRAATASRQKSIADKALSFIAGRPQLTLMGPIGLLEIAERELLRESEKGSLTDPSTILKPELEFSPTEARP